MWTLIINVIDSIRKKEKESLSRTGIKGLLLGRFYSLVSICLMVYLSLIILTVLVVQVLMTLKLQPDGTIEYWWSLPLIFALPTLIPLIANFTDRDFIYSEVFYNILTTIKYSNHGITFTRLFFESIIFILYIGISSFLTILAIAYFVNEQAIMVFVKSDLSRLIKAILPLHVVIYLTMRVLILPERNPKEKFKKIKRKFYLWVIALFVAAAYMIYKIFNSGVFSLDYLYLVFAVFIATDRVIGTYKELHRTLLEVQPSNGSQTANHITTG